MSSVKIALDLAAGGELELFELERDQAVALSSEAAPPGSTIEAGRGPAVVRIKVRRCRREPGSEPARYRIEGRLVGLSNAARDALLALNAG